MKQDRMPKIFQEYLEEYIWDYYRKTGKVITNIHIGAIGVYPKGSVVQIEGAYFELEDGKDFVNESVRLDVIELKKDMIIGSTILEAGDKIEIIREGESITEATPTPQEVGDKLKGVSLVDARKPLEDLFGKKNVDWSTSIAPHFSIKTPDGLLVVINKKSIQPDKDTIIAGELAIGYM